MIDRLLAHSGIVCIGAAAACLTVLSCSNNVDPVAARSSIGESESSESDASILEGHWSGSWGGAAQGDVVFQPVPAELVIEGQHVELSGFPDTAPLTGTIRYDTDASRITITGAVEEGAANKPHRLEYTYDVNGDQLSLTSRDHRTVSLLRRRPVQAKEGPPAP